MIDIWRRRTIPNPGTYFSSKNTSPVQNPTALKNNPWYKFKFKIMINVLKKKKKSGMNEEGRSIDRSMNPPPVLN